MQDQSAYQRGRLVVLAPLMALLVVMLTGCSGAVATVSGEITFDNKPIEEGNIRLDPLGKEDGAEGASAAITAGKYEITKSAALKPGKYRVSITATGKTGRKVKSFEKLEGEQGGKMDEVIQYIPWTYNRDSTLELEVTAGDNPGKNFPLSSSS